MSGDGKPSSSDLDGFNKRLERSKKAIQAKDAANSRIGSAYSFGFRLATDLIAGVLGGFGIGWGLDYLLGTSPWLLLIFTPLGIVAGILNVIRAAKSVEARRHLEQTQSSAPAVSDDEDD